MLIYLLVLMVILYIHTSHMGGHLRIHKTIAKIYKEFIWKGMGMDIGERVRACHLCSLSEPIQNAKLGLLSCQVAFPEGFNRLCGSFPK